MRVLLRMEIDPEKGSQALADGTMQRTLAELMERVKPEAQYFGPNEHGLRTAWLVFDFTDPSKMPPLFEPLFSRLGAHVTMLPVMTLQELQRGFQQLG